MNPNRAKLFPSNRQLNARLVRRLGDANALAVASLVERGGCFLEVQLDAFDVVVAAHVGASA